MATPSGSQEELSELRTKMVEAEAERRRYKDLVDNTADHEERMQYLKLLTAVQERLTALDQQKVELLKQSADTGAGGSGGSNPEVSQLRREIMKLSVQVNKASHSTRTHADMGKDVRVNAKEGSLSRQGLAHLAEGDVRIARACAEITKLFPDARPKGTIFKRVKDKSAPPAKRGRQESSTGAADLEMADPDEEDLLVAAIKGLPGLSLADITAPGSSRPKFKEDPHMQQPMFKVLNTAALACKSDVYLLDTHSASGLSHPTVNPDAVALVAVSDTASWPQIAYTFEFKLDSSGHEMDVMAGQLLQRSAAVLDAQPDRRSVLGVGLTMNQIEVFNFSRGNDGKLSIERSGLVPFSISEKSPGFQLLCSVLCTGKQAMGFVAAPVPSIPKLGSYQVPDSWQLLRRGSGAGASYVYAVGPAGEEGKAMVPSAVVKLNQSTREGLLLERLRNAGVKHVVKLLGTPESVMFDRVKWNALAVAPFVQFLSCKSGIKLFAQVAHDIAVGLQDAFVKAQVLQRDVTPNNFGYHDGRGCLFDFSAGKDMQDLGTQEPPVSPTGKLEDITGTMLWAPYSVLCDSPHSLSSQLEGLFISLVYIASDGRVIGRHGAGKDRASWAGRRRAQFGGNVLLDSDNVAEDLLPLVQDLHGLFWPLAAGQRVRGYRDNVSCAEVVQACKRACQDITSE